MEYAIILVSKKGVKKMYSKKIASIKKLTEKILNFFNRKKPCPLNENQILQKNKNDIKMGQKELDIEMAWQKIFSSLKKRTVQRTENTKSNFMKKASAAVCSKTCPEDISSNVSLMLLVCEKSEDPIARKNATSFLSNMIVEGLEMKYRSSYVIVASFSENEIARKKASMEFLPSTYSKWALEEIVKTSRYEDSWKTAKEKLEEINKRQI